MKSLHLPLPNNSVCRYCLVSEKPGYYQNKMQLLLVAHPCIRECSTYVHLHRTHLTTDRNSAAAVAPVVVIQVVGSRRMV